MVNKKLHFEEIDICKGIAILLVVIYHAFIRYPINLVEVPWCNYIMDVIRSFFMPLFAQVCFSTSPNVAFSW